MRVSIIIPCFNCQRIIKNSILKLEKKLKKFRKIKYELIFVDDGSTDNTVSIINNFVSKNIKLIKNHKNLGKSESLKRGINVTKYNRIILIDCDLPYFKYLDIVLYKLKTENFIYINRKSKKSKVINKNLNLYQISRYLIGRSICYLLNLFFFNSEVGDTQAGLKAFKKPKNFSKFKFISKKFFLDAELMILYHRSKIKMLSIPVNYKIYSSSSIRIIAFDNFKYLFELAKVILFYKLLKTKNIKIKTLL
jgi:glycosyltransferase involved in cell wall biosynthesis